MKRSSCNLDTIIIGDSLLRSSRSQIRRRRNRFIFSWSHAASPSWSMLLMLVVVVVAALMLPCSTAKSLAEPTTTLIPTDNDNSDEFTTEVTAYLPVRSPPQLANTTTSQVSIDKVIDLSIPEEDNEIFAVLEISPDIMAVKPKFELSETGDLEETIRNSVKSEIEIEQNLGSAAILDVLKDIPETEVRQRIAEEILSIDYPQKITKEHNFASKESVKETQHEISVSSTLTNDVIDRTTTHDFEQVILIGNATTNISAADMESSSLQHPVEENIREARNLDAEVKENLNTLSKIESSNVRHIQEKFQTEFPEHTQLTKIEKPFELKTALSSSDSSSLSSSESNSADNSAENDENAIDSVENRFSTEINVKQFDLTTLTSAETTPVKIPNGSESSTSSSVENDGLSIVLNETLSATEPPTPTLLDDDKLENFINLEATNDISNIDEITIAPEENVHIVFKKQGVDLNSDLSIDTIGGRGLDISPEMSVSSATENVYDDVKNGNTELPIEPIILVDENNSVDLKGREFNFESSTVQPEVIKQEVNVESDVPLVVTTTEIIEITTVEPEQESHSETEEFSTKLVEDKNFVITLKGSRSINTNNPISNVDDTAATLFEAFPPRDAGQTLNDNLAAESFGGIGKALPTRSINSDSANRSGIIIVLCSGTAILFIVILLVIFLMSFQRQHGTLDIEMHEQRCGKDNLDEEDVETCIKLLNVELPPPTSTVDADETDECL